MNDLQQRLLTVLENIGGIGKTAELQQRGNIAKSIEVIECNLAGLMRLKLIGQKGTLWILGKHLPVEKKKKSRGLDRLHARKNIVKLNKSNASLEAMPVAMPVAMPETVGELEDSVEADSLNSEKENEGSECVVISAIGRLKEKLEEKNNDIIAVNDFQLKYDALLMLAEITEESISDLLNEVRDDITYLNSLFVDEREDASV